MRSWKAIVRIENKVIILKMWRISFLGFIRNNKFQEVSLDDALTEKNSIHFFPQKSAQHPLLPKNPPMFMTLLHFSINFEYVILLSKTT